MRKGKANIFGCISVINGSYGDADKTGERLVPRTEELPLYTTEEFNDKVTRWKRPNFAPESPVTSIMLICI